LKIVVFTQIPLAATVMAGWSRTELGNGIHRVHHDRMHVVRQAAGCGFFINHQGCRYPVRLVMIAGMGWVIRMSFLLWKCRRENWGRLAIAVKERDLIV
jgi:hypothetical protein